MSAAQRIREAVTAIKANPARAEQLCREALQERPGDGDAQLLLSEALRLQGKFAEARAAAEAQVAARPTWFGVHRQLGVILTDMGDFPAAFQAASRAVELNPELSLVWRELGNLHLRLGNIEQSHAAFDRYTTLPIVEPVLLESMRALSMNNVEAAGDILSERIKVEPNDVVAIRILSEIEARSNRPDLAEKSLRRCLDLAPSFTLARHSLGQLLNGLARHEEAMAQVEELLRRDPDNAAAERLLAATYGGCGEFEKAIAIYERQLAAQPAQPSIWLGYGHILKTVGRSAEAVTAYKRSLEFAPALGIAYWSLANLKTFKFTTADIVEMRRLLLVADLPAGERVNFHYALGKALEDAGETEAAFQHYDLGARLHRKEVVYDRDRHSESISRGIEILSGAFFASRRGVGDASPDPIFVVGLPRSGSTLVEQILASHSAVEGTMELPNMALIASDLCSYERAAAGGSYLDALATLDDKAFAALGAHFLDTTRMHRRLGRPFFIDKTPNNWSLIGLIHLMLPNAKIIDARRHPMATCFSCYKQHFAQGQPFTYDLTDLGRYYNDYLRMMAHWDAVLPGRVHRVIHEDLIVDPETHIRALLNYCGLPFEPACLKPHETQRAVVTASSEQVRRPINSGGVLEWRRFESWLGPLESALGGALTGWRA